jgi:hypothetical protein
MTSDPAMLLRDPTVSPAKRSATLMPSDITQTDETAAPPLDLAGTNCSKEVIPLTAHQLTELPGLLLRRTDSPSLDAQLIPQKIWNRPTGRHQACGVCLERI